MRKIIGPGFTIACAVAGSVAFLAWSGTPPPKPKPTLASVQQSMVNYCESQGQLAMSWPETDTDGNVTYYGRCVSK